MISICIPVYNYDVSRLVTDLSIQAESSYVPVEIIIIDDFSEERYRRNNRLVCKEHIYIELDHNTGRARIRNLFITYANYRYLLFLDCDSIISSSNFLEKYIGLTPQQPSVVCGGSTYTLMCPGRRQKLRWKYGKLRESKPADIRNGNPHRSFLSNNFLADRRIFDRIKFDENLSGYGYEDTLFGYSLRKAGIEVIHTDNQVLNGGLESNKAYLKKTREAVLNLVEMVKSGRYGDDLNDYISLLHFYNKIEKYKNCIGLVYIVFRPVIYFLLARGYIFLALFDLYRQGLFLRLSRSLQSQK